MLIRGRGGGPKSAKWAWGNLWTLPEGKKKQRLFAAKREKGTGDLKIAQMFSAVAKETIRRSFWLIFGHALAGRIYVRTLSNRSMDLKKVRGLTGLVCSVLAFWCLLLLRWGISFGLKVHKQRHLFNLWRGCRWVWGKGTICCRREKPGRITSKYMGIPRRLVKHKSYLNPKKWWEDWIVYGQGHQYTPTFPRKIRQMSRKSAHGTHLNTGLPFFKCGRQRSVDRPLIQSIVLIETSYSTKVSFWGRQQSITHIVLSVASRDWQTMLCDERLSCRVMNAARREEDDGEDEVLETVIWLVQRFSETVFLKLRNIPNPSVQIWTIAAQAVSRIEGRRRNYQYFGLTRSFGISWPL